MIKRTERYLPYWIATTIVCCMSLVPFVPCYDGDFVFDDSEAIVGNADVKCETSISELFAHDFWGKRVSSNTSHKSYRPITTLTFRLNYWLSGDLHAPSFHLTNLLLHSLVSVLSLHIFHQLFTESTSQLTDMFTRELVPHSAILSAVIFAVHPVHSESVCGVVGRADLLCAVFFFLSLHFYMASCQQGSPGFLILSMVSCVISAFCKEQGITVLGVCCVYDLILVRRVNLRDILTLKIVRLSQTCPSSLKLQQPPTFTCLIRHLAMIVTGVIILLHRWTIMDFTPPTFTQHDNPHSFVNGTLLRMLNYNYIYSINNLLLFLPHWLCFDWSMGCVPTIASVTDPRVMSVVLMWIIYLALILSCLKRVTTHEDRLTVVAVSMVIIPFLPASNLFVRVGFVIAERALYLPTAGYAIILAVGVNRLGRRSKTLQYCVTVGVWVVLLAFLAKSLKRSTEWRTELDLFTSGDKVCPRNAKLQYNIGKVHADLGNIDYAIKKYRLAISLNDEYDQPLNNLGNLLKERGELVEAERLLIKATHVNYKVSMDTKQSIEVKPDIPECIIPQLRIHSPRFAAAWMNLGITQASLKKYRESETSYLTALRHRNKYPDCYYNLGNMYLEIDQHGAAMEAWRSAIAIKPTHFNAWNNLVIHLDNLGKLDEGITTAREALSHIPHNPPILYTLANILGKAGHYGEGEMVYKELIGIQPNNADAHANLGVLYHRWGKLELAATSYAKALHISPHNHNARSNYDMLKKKLKDNR